MKPDFYNHLIILLISIDTVSSNLGIRPIFRGRDRAKEPLYKLFLPPKGHLDPCGILQFK